MAKIRKRDDGLYQKNIIVGRNPDGSYKRKTVYAKTHKEMEEKIAELTTQMQSGIRIDDDATFAKMANIWLDNYRDITETNWAIQQRRTVNKYLIPYIGDMSVKKLTKYDLQTVINMLRDKGYSTSSMKKVRDVAAQIIEVAVDKNLVLTNPFRKVTVASIPPQQRRFLTEEEIDRISNTWDKHRMGLAGMMMLYCGLRRGEMIALDWADIDLDAKVVHITKSVTVLHSQCVIKGPKSKAGVRDIPIPDFFVDILRDAPKDNPIFCPSVMNGGRLSEVAYNRAWESYENMLNEYAGGQSAVGHNRRVVVIEHITAHMFRHTYASLLYEAGVDVKSAQRYLGHSDIETTLEIYTHLTKKKEDEAVRNINEHFANYVYKRKSKDKDEPER